MKQQKILKMKISSAVVQEGHRFQLSRIWEPLKPKCVWVMLNPSYADAEEDDPTIRRIITFSDIHGYGGFHVVNLCSYITPDPKVLIEWLEYIKYGPTCYWYNRNFNTIQDTIGTIGRKNIIFAWGSKGAHPALRPIVEKITKIYSQHSRMFGLTANKQPKHPLYLPNHSELVAFPYNSNKKW